MMSKKAKYQKRQPTAPRLFFTSFSHHISGVVGLFIITLLVLSSIFAVPISGYDPVSFDPMATRLSPSWSHIMGTDQLGQDVFSRVLFGARASIYIGVMSSLLATIIGSFFGSIAGYKGGKFDSVMMRVSEVFMTFPELILVLIIGALLGTGVNNIILIFAGTSWMTTFRLVRGEFFSLREEAFVEADRAFGFSKKRIIFRHLLPNTLSPIVVAFTTNTAIYIIAEAGLSFLGLGVPITTPTWGNLLAAAREPSVVNQYWWLWVFPALAIIIFVFAVNKIGDALRDVLDPRTFTSTKEASQRFTLFKKKDS